MRTEYLTEKLLREFVQERFKECSFIFDKSYFNEYRFRQDIVIPEKKLILEFNGDSHYKSTERILKDREKEIICKNKGFTLIEIPYFVQLDSRLVSFLFKKYIEDLSSFNIFAQGFISKKAILPADFCMEGLYRFSLDLQKFNIVSKEILESLDNKVKELKHKSLVYPLGIRDLLINPPKP